MKAVICKEFGEGTVAEVERPTPDPKEVLVEVLQVQLNVTECQLFRGECMAHYETVAERIDRGDGRLFGHEFCGRVLEVGADITGLSEGGRVYAPGKIPASTVGRGSSCIVRTRCTSATTAPARWPNMRRSRLLH